MATNPHDIEMFAIIRPYVIPATKVVTQGFRVKFSGADNQVENCGAGDDGFAIALQSGVAGDTVLCLLEGHAVVPVKVGTGGATRGSFARCVADGMTDVVVADGVNPRNIPGKFLQSGPVGDLVGLLVAASTPTPTA